MIVETVVRKDNRPSDGMREFSITPDIQPQAFSSLLMITGATQVICTVSLEERVPSFLERSGQGWITAEYGMLPGATDPRYRREIDGRSGRSMEIQRLIGRSLRQMVDLQQIGAVTLRVDCDVLNADGGTRTAAITGAALALRGALLRMHRDGRLVSVPKMLPVAAVSAGVVDGEVLLDLDYQEDSRAEVDGNFVMVAGRWAEIQATAEKRPLCDEEFVKMMAFARGGIERLSTLWPDCEIRTAVC